MAKPKAGEGYFQPSAESAVVADAPEADAPDRMAVLEAEVQRLQAAEAERATAVTTVIRKIEHAIIHGPQGAVTDAAAPSSHRPRAITATTHPALFDPIVLERHHPEAQFPDECVLACRLVGKGVGYWPCYPKPSRQVAFADPGQRFLVPHVPVGEFRPMEQFTNPRVNVIGEGRVVPYHIPALNEAAYCDPRAAAGTRSGLLIDKFALWCPVFETDGPNSPHHSEHGAFCGIGETPDLPYATRHGVSILQQVLTAPEDAGRCIRCKGSSERRESARQLARRWKSRG